MSVDNWVATVALSLQIVLKGLVDGLHDRHGLLLLLLDVDRQLPEVEKPFASVGIAVVRSCFEFGGQRLQNL